MLDVEAFGLAFRIFSRIGRGGTGDVFAARVRCKFGDRAVAVKAIHDSGYHRAIREMNANRRLAGVDFTVPLLGSFGTEHHTLMIMVRSSVWPPASTY